MSHIRLKGLITERARFNRLLNNETFIHDKKSNVVIICERCFSKFHFLDKIKHYDKNKLYIIIVNGTRNNFKHCHNSFVNAFPTKPNNVFMICHNKLNPNDKVTVSILNIIKSYFNGENWDNKEFYIS